MKGYTAEEASFPETEANEGQWLEPTDSSLYDTWQVDSSSWDWNAEADWEEAEVHFQDWETSQDWHYSASWLATVLQGNDSREDLLSRVSGLLCRASGHDDDYSQLSVEDVTGHSLFGHKDWQCNRLGSEPDQRNT